MAGEKYRLTGKTEKLRRLKMQLGHPATGSFILDLLLLTVKTIAFATDMDAAIVSSLGPYSEVEAVKIIAAPVGSLTSTMVLTNTGRVLKFEDQYRWPVFANDLSNISYAIGKA